MQPLSTTAINPAAPKDPAGWAVTALAAAWFVIAAAASPPVLDPGIRLAVMSAFATVCHQLPDRSFHVDGVPLGVCHRCLGIFAGIALGAGVGLLSHVARRLTFKHAGGCIVAALVPVGLDWSLDAIGLIRNTTSSRLATGTVFGLLLGMLLIAALKARLRPYPESDEP